MPSSNFKVLRQSGRFVDKTLFLKHHLRQRKVSAIFRPHGFGKTVIAEMTDCFYRLELDERLNELPQAERTNLSFFRDTKIWNDVSNEMSHMGNYPLIHLRFNKIRWANFEDGLREVMNAAYEEYGCYDDPEKNLEDSLERLILILNERYKKRVVVIIDEFDTPLNCLIWQFHSSRTSNEEYEKLNKFSRVYSCLIEAVVRSDLAFRVEFALLLGNINLSYLPLCASYIFPYGASPSTLIRLNGFSSDLFGFTKEEIIGRCFPKTIESHTLNAMREWYGGHTSNTTRILEEKLFTPHSVISCIESGFVMDNFADDLSKYPMFITKSRNIDAIIKYLGMFANSDVKIHHVFEPKPIKVAEDSETDAIKSFTSTLFQHGLISYKYDAEVDCKVCKRSLSVTNKECKIILWKKFRLASLVKDLNRSNYPKRGLVDSISNYKWSPKFTAHLEKYVLEILAEI